MLIVIESLVMCFILLLVCVVGIANGPVELVTFYEKDVQDRVVELGLTTKAKIKRNTVYSSLALFVPVLFLVPFMVYSVNGARNFTEGFWQMSIILWIMGLFDRLFIDWYWVSKTKAWFIPGTEDLMPYIPTKTRVRKWLGTIIFYPIYAAIVAWIMMYVG